jgi:predicted MFS family arabinose efflux permease
MLRRGLEQRAGRRRGAVTAHSIDTSPGPAWRTRAWAIVGALSITETVSWGILYYAFAAFLVPMQRDLGYSVAQLTGAFSLALGVSALAGIIVGRQLDRRSPRALMTAGSIAGSGLVVAWSQVHGLAAFYVLWLAIGVVMATVLYEPAFTVVAKHFPEPGERRRAMTSMTLVAALASFIFLPLSQVLIDAYGWRDALLVLAVILAAITVPLHGLVLRPGPRAPEHIAASTPAGDAFRSLSFWLLSGAFVLASLSTIAMTVFSIPFLLERGHSAGFAAFAVGLIGVSQIPGRVLFAPLYARVSRALATATVFACIALGITVVVTVHATVAVLVGLVLLGMGNGMATLARATAIADLYGAGAYGTIAAVAGGMTTAARAAGPFAAALYAAAVGFTALLWTLAGLALAAAVLAYRAESSTARGTTTSSASVRPRSG